MKKTTSKLLVASLATAAIVAPMANASAAATEIAEGVYFSKSLEFYTLAELENLSVEKIAELFTENDFTEVYLNLPGIGAASIDNDENFVDVAKDPETVIPSGSYTTSDGSKVEIDGAVTGELTVESVSAINKTRVEVTFSQEVDKATAGNFTIAGGKVNSASISEDKKTVTLDVSGLEYGTEYTIVAKDLVYNGEASGTLTETFTTPEVTELWNLEVIPGKASIEANGIDNTTVTFQLVDKVTGEVDKNANDLVLDLNTTYGSLAQKRATIQNGTATVVLRSEFNAKGVTAKVEAQIIEASGDYQDLIGQVAGTVNVQFVAPGSSEVDAVYLTAANTNEADRVTLTFDKAVSVADFVETNDDGQLLGTLRTDNKVEITQTVAGKSLTVKGFLPGSTSNTLVAVLDIADANAVNPTEVLTDNADVKVAVTMLNTAGQETKSEQEFKFTDARVPNVTSVNPVGLNKLSVKFSEPVAQADFLIDGFYTAPTHFEVKHGTFAFDTESKTFVDNRNLVTLTLKDAYKESGDDALEGYFTPGAHALQVSKINDFAALSDNNNIGSSQNLGFNVAANSDLAVSTVKVDSPNQYRFTFDKDATLDTNEVELQVYDTTDKAWVKAEAGKGDLKVDPTFTVDSIKGDTAIGQYKVEVTSKWTDSYETATTNNNYYNDKYRLVVKKGALKTDVNGKVNAADIELPLNFAGSAMNTPDTKSPVISKIENTDTAGIYVVTMDEPITGDLAKEVEFIGKDKDGKVRTFKGKATSYTGDRLDTKFYVDTNINSTVASPGATEYDLIKDLVLKGGSEDWTLVLKDVTDDIGNKAATETKDFKITAKELASKFEVVSSGNPVKYEVEGSKDGNETITITFTENVALTGVGSAIDVANFSLNGADLPTSSSIALAEDNGAAVENKIVITVKEGTLKEGSNVITLGKNLVSKEGKALTGAHAFTFFVDAAEVLPTGVVATPGTFADGEDAVEASKAIGGLTFTAKEAGLAGNDLTVAILAAVDATNADTTSETTASITSNDITIQLGSGWDTAVVAATAQDVVDAIAANADVAAKITVGSTGTPVVAAKTNLASGADAVVATADLTVTVGAVDANGQVEVLVDTDVIGTINVSKGDSVNTVASKIADLTFTDYTASASAGTVTFTAKVGGAAANSGVVTLKDVE